MASSQGRFSPRQPDPTVNVSDTHPLAEAAILTAGLGATFIALAVIGVYLVDILVGVISVEREARWFGHLEPEGIGEMVNDHPADGEARALLARIAEQWPESVYSFNLMITETETPNAMAVPGGTIILTTGLLDSVQSENELAFVLAHELGHFHGRDHLRRVGRLAFLGLIYATFTNNGAIGFNISELTLRGFNRQQESDADAFGLSLSYALYGHVNGSGDFFERISDNQQNVITRYTDTHPEPKARIAELHAIARENGWNLEGPLTPWMQATDRPPITKGMPDD